jgi:glycosyltransferase involved in cell wall biosynthesis
MSSNVSVLIPAHGASPYIQYTLKSIATNTIQPDEIWIVDDGLSQEAIIQINFFSHSLPIVVIPNTGKGLVDALNTGLQAAKGKYIARIDNDDLMAKNRIERQLMQFESDPNLVAIGSQCYYIDSEGARTGRSNYPHGTLNSLSIFKTKCLIAHPSTMYLRRSALNIGGYRSLFTWDGVDIAEDFDFWLRIAREGIISVSEELLTEYRQHSEQLSYRHLAGQHIGTPYVSAVNIENLAKPQKIEFNHGNSTEISALLNSIKVALGIRSYLASRLAIYHFRENRFAKNRFIYHIISRLISLLQR